jgi:hypothetical protein
MGLAALGGFYQYLTSGPHEIPDQAEEEAKALQRGQQERSAR